MKLSEANENRRIIMISVVILLLMAGLFISAANYLLLSQFDQPTSEEVSYQDVSFIKETGAEYVQADYTIEVGLVAENTNALSPEAAAEEGARYLWEVMNVDLSGKKIYLQYALDNSRGLAYWHGDIHWDGEPWEAVPEYTFSIDAISGRWSSLYSYTDFEARETTMYLRSEADEYYRKNCSEILEIAKQHAAKQMSAEIVSAEFFETRIKVASGYIYDRPNLSDKYKELLDANQVIRVPMGEPIPVEYIGIVVIVTDEAGARLEVEIDTVNKELRGLNELYDGIDYFPDGLG